MLSKSRPPTRLKNVVLVSKKIKSAITKIKSEIYGTERRRGISLFYFLTCIFFLNRCDNCS